MFEIELRESLVTPHQGGSRCLTQKENRRSSTKNNWKRNEINTLREGRIVKL